MSKTFKLTNVLKSRIVQCKFWKQVKVKLKILPRLELGSKMPE